MVASQPYIIGNHLFQQHIRHSWIHVIHCSANTQLATVQVAAPDHFVLLRLRWIQLRHAFPAYGIVLLGAAILVVIWSLHTAIRHDASLAPYIAGGSVFMVFGFHQRRADHVFLQRHLPQPQVAMAVEYAAFLVPVMIALSFTQAWNWSTLLVLVAGIPWFPLKQGSGVRGRRYRKHIPTALFEWKAMLQSTHPIGVLLFVAALAFCWLPVLPLFLLGAIAMMVAGVQEQCEPRSMLLATANDARALLRLKVFGSMRIMLITVLPVIIGATIFRPEWWWIHALFGVGMLVLVAYAIVLKYANYRPNVRLEANGANVAVVAVFAILPGLSLVPLIMLLTELPRARANLNAYFHDHHH